MTEPFLFDPGPPDPKNDAAPQLGRNGASADENLHPNGMHSDFAHSAPVRRNAPDTSREAARRMEGIAGPLCQRVLTFIRGRGCEGATDAECQTALGLLTQTQTPRRNALAKAGEVVDSGLRRLTPSGRRAIVWVTPDRRPNGGGSTP